MKYIFAFLLGFDAGAAELRGQVLADAGSFINGGYGIDISCPTSSPYSVGALFSKRNIDGYARTEKPTGMYAIHGKYHFMTGFYVGGALTYVTLIREEDNKKFERFGKMVLAGYQLNAKSFALKIGMGYGDGSPYIGMYENRFFAGLFDYSYFDAGVGFTF